MQHVYISKAIIKRKETMNPEVDCSKQEVEAEENKIKIRSISSSSQTKTVEKNIPKRRNNLLTVISRLPQTIKRSRSLLL